MSDFDDERPLFCSQDLSDLLDSHLMSARNAVTTIAATDMIDQPSDRIVQEIVKEYRLQTTRLNRDQMKENLTETRVDVRYDSTRAISNPSRPTMVPATRIEYRVPFSGANLFRHKPNQFTLNPPRARIDGTHVVLGRSIPNDVFENERDSAIAELRSEIDEIERWLEWIRIDLEKWESQLRRVVENEVNSRRANLVKMRETESMLGAPVVRRDNIGQAPPASDGLQRASSTSEVAETRQFKLDTMAPTSEAPIVQTFATPTHQIIQQGESKWVEFKQTARVNIRTQQPDQAMEKEIIKTVAGFMNSSGGTLLIGVSDDGEVTGIETDYKTLGKKQNADSFAVWLNNRLDQALGPTAVASTTFSFDRFDTGTVCRVDVEPGTTPTFETSKQGDANLYIRLNNTTRRLNTEEAVDYVQKHWP